VTSRFDSKRIDAAIRGMERQLTAVEEELHAPTALRSWFGRVPRWLLARRVRRLKAELAELYVRRRWRVEGR